MKARKVLRVSRVPAAPRVLRVPEDFRDRVAMLVPKGMKAPPAPPVPPVLKALVDYKALRV